MPWLNLVRLRYIRWKLASPGWSAEAKSWELETAQPDEDRRKALQKQSLSKPKKRQPLMAAQPDEAKRGSTDRRGRRPAVVETMAGVLVL